jgi:hypothetical protein
MTCSIVAFSDYSYDILYTNSNMIIDRRMQANGDRTPLVAQLVSLVTLMYTLSDVRIRLGTFLSLCQPWEFFWLPQRRGRPRQ